MSDLSLEQKAALYDEVSRDRGLFRQMQRGLAQLHPEMSIPEVELEDRITAISRDAEERAQKLEQELAAERAERQAEKAALEIKARHGIDDSELGVVAETMQKNGITNFDTALKFHKLESEQSKREQPLADRLSMRMSDSFAAGLKNRRGQRRANLYAALNETRAAARHANFLSTN